MATLKEHQAAMVDLLTNGSGIPASASRLAHAMHDVLAVLGADGSRLISPLEYSAVDDATTPGLNDKAFSKREKALKTDSPAKWPTPAEQRVKELENTIKQLKANNAKLKADKCELEDQVEAYRHMAIPEQAGCRKSDTQVCEHAWVNRPGLFIMPGSVHNREPYEFCTKCGAKQ